MHDFFVQQEKSTYFSNEFEYGILGFISYNYALYVFRLYHLHQEMNNG